MSRLQLLLRPGPRAAGLAGAVATAVLIGILTVLIPNSFFRRMTPVRPLDYVFWVATAALIGAIAATFAVRGAGSACQTRTFGGGGLAVLAVGCPVCNKVVVLLLGVSGALNYFAPLQPVIGTAAVGLLIWTLMLRIDALPRDRSPREALA